MDLSTKKGIERFVVLRQLEMTRCFEQKGRFETSNGLAYMAYVFARHGINTPSLHNPKTWTTGRELAAIQAVPVELPPDVIEQTDWKYRTRLLGNALREFARLTRATGVLIMTEAWFVEHHGEPGSVPPDYQYGWVEKQPDRKEAMMIMLQHATFGDAQYYSIIHREPTRLEPWAERTGPDGKPGLFGEGRLTGMNDWRRQ